MEEILPLIPDIRLFFATSAFSKDAPEFADDLFALAGGQSVKRPDITGTLTEQDFGAIYFSSGTTGFPKAILHRHLSLITAARVEHAHHGQTKDDVFICIPPLYHTGAKMHWFGSLYSCSRAVLLRGVPFGKLFRGAPEEKKKETSGQGIRERKQKTK